MHWDVPQKKWVESDVIEIEVTPPGTWEAHFIVMSWMEILARVPSPDPTIKSEFGKPAITLTPWENNFLTGATLLKIAFSTEIYYSKKKVKNKFNKLTSIMSPVFVPQ